MSKKLELEHFINKPNLLNEPDFSRMSPTGKVLGSFTAPDPIPSTTKKHKQQEAVDSGKWKRTKTNPIWRISHWIGDTNRPGNTPAPFNSPQTDLISLTQ